MNIPGPSLVFATVGHRGCVHLHSSDDRWTIRPLLLDLRQLANTSTSYGSLLRVEFVESKVADESRGILTQYPLLQGRMDQLNEMGSSLQGEVTKTDLGIEIGSKLQRQVNTVVYGGYSWLL